MLGTQGEGRFPAREAPHQSASPQSSASSHRRFRQVLQASHPANPCLMPPWVASMTSALIVQSGEGWQCEDAGELPFHFSPSNAADSSFITSWRLDPLCLSSSSFFGLRDAYLPENFAKTSPIPPIIKLGAGLLLSRGILEESYWLTPCNCSIPTVKPHVSLAGPEASMATFFVCAPTQSKQL